MADKSTIKEKILKESNINLTYSEIFKAFEKLVVKNKNPADV